METYHDSSGQEISRESFIESQEKEHDIEERLLRESGWSPLDVVRTFYLYDKYDEANRDQAIGVKRTVVVIDTTIPSYGFDHWEINGDVLPPDNSAKSISVYEWVKNGDEYKWVEIERYKCSYDGGKQGEWKSLDLT
ncbi:MAG: hypothetical protein WAX44_02275 [Minisyncoccia bacterium]